MTHHLWKLRWFYTSTNDKSEHPFPVLSPTVITTIVFFFFLLQLDRKKKRCLIFSAHLYYTYWCLGDIHISHSYKYTAFPNTCFFFTRVLKFIQQILSEHLLCASPGLSTRDTRINKAGTFPWLVVQQSGGLESTWQCRGHKSDPLVQESKISHATEQLSLHITTREPTCCNEGPVCCN